MKYTYVKDHKNGRAVSANTGEGIYEIYRFTSRKEAIEFVDGYNAPNHCPQAFAEIVKRKEIESEIRIYNAHGDRVKFWEIATPNYPKTENYDILIG